MESTPEQPATPEALAVRQPSRLKAVIVGLTLAGVLSAWGAASVFAADPSASPAASSGAVASDDGNSSAIRWPTPVGVMPLIPFRDDVPEPGFRLHAQQRRGS